MDKTQNHWIALYLCGKYPWLHKTPDKLLFMDSLSHISSKDFSDEKFKMFWMFWTVDEYEFYLSFLNKVERDYKDNYIELIGKLDIPDEIKNKLKTIFNHNYFLQELNNLKTITHSQTKWTAFENFLKELFWKIDWLTVINSKPASDEQIDLIIKNNINTPFCISLHSPLIIVEAKNHEKNTPTEVINTMRWKLCWHNNLSRVWIIISLNWFTSEVEKNQIRDWAWDKVLVAIDWNDIEEMLTNKEDPILWIENKITEAFK